MICQKKASAIIEHLYHDVTEQLFMSDLLKTIYKDSIPLINVMKTASAGLDAMLQCVMSNALADVWFLQESTIS